MERSAQAGRLCVLLLEQGPGCSWIIGKDLTFGCIFGNSLPLFGKSPDQLSGASLPEALPGGRGEPWRERMARVLGGETLVLRERGASKALFSITAFPLRDGGAEPEAAGCLAVEMTALEGVEQELRHAVLNVMKAQEKERASLARFLHDEVGQCLSATGLQLDLLRMDAESKALDVPGRTREIQQLLEGVMERVRAFSYELNPAMVERAGLYSALDRMAGRIGRSFGGTLRLMADQSLRFDAAVAGPLYKIAEEAVNNAVKHADCAVLEVLLKATRTGQLLEVRDNGRGFDVAEVNARRSGLGFLIMQHCASEAGIELSVSSALGRGTNIRAVVRQERECAGR